MPPDDATLVVSVPALVSDHTDTNLGWGLGASGDTGDTGDGGGKGLRWPRPELVATEPRRDAAAEAAEKILLAALASGLSFRGWWRRSQLAMDERSSACGGSKDAPSSLPTCFSLTVTPRPPF